MTPEELDAARIAEAERRYHDNQDSVRKTFVLHLCDVFNEGWAPPPEPVDPDLLAAREWYTTIWTVDKAKVMRGDADTSHVMRAYLAGCTRGREGAKGLVEALDWYSDPYNYIPLATNSTSVPIGHDCGRRALAALAAAKGERV